MWCWRLSTVPASRTATSWGTVRRVAFGPRAAPAFRLRLLHDPAGVAACLPCRGAASRGRAPAAVGRPGPHRRRGGRGAAGRARDLRRRLPGGASGPGRMGGDAGPGAGPGRQAPGAAGRGERRRPGPAGHPGDRQAAGRGQGRGHRDRRHLRLLRRRGPAAVRPDGAERDAGQAAVHLPPAGRGGGGHHRRQLPGGGAVLVPGPGAAVRQRGGVEAGRVRRRPPPRPWPSCSLARRPARRRPQPGPGRRGGHLRRPGRRPRRRPGRQGRLHRLHRGRAAHRRALRPPPPGRPAWSWAARTRWW